MKLILIVEENGYELRYWDEITEEVGDSIAASWDVELFHQQLINMNFNISKRVLIEAIRLIEEEKQDFVIFASKNKPNKLDTLHDDVFIIEK